MNNGNRTIRTYQREMFEWVIRNFADYQGVVSWHQQFMGLVEEVGELSHALLKQEQHIRGMEAEHEAAAKDAVGDILVYLFNLCSCRGWDVQDILETVWDTVSKRDWRKDSKTGGEVSNG